MKFNPIIIVPCFNHADAFAGVADKLIAYETPVLVVDDGSDLSQSRKIKNICSKHNFMYVKNVKNGGKGAAMITGFNFAMQNGFTHALQIDADGQHDINDIKLFLDIAGNHPNELIVGNPIYDESAPKSRLIGRKITRFWVMVETLSTRMPDTMCGFRVYPLQEIIPVLKTIRFKRMGFDIEIMVKIAQRKIPIITVPTRVIYPENGISHFHAFRDNFYISLLHTYLCCLIPFNIIQGMFKHEKNH